MLLDVFALLCWFLATKESQDQYSWQLLWRNSYDYEILCDQCSMKEHI